jgi:hypothetical protein
MNDIVLSRLIDILWPPSDDPDAAPVHWLLDGARDPQIADLVRSSGLEYACLFNGQLHPRLEAAAPYLVHLPLASAAAKQLLSRGWGRAWGIFVIAEPNVAFAEHRLHWKKFLRVQTEQGQALAFRYYDPRVLNIFLPTCTGDELRTFFGPAIRLMAESDEGARLRTFALQDGALRTQEYPLTGSPPPLL